MIMNPGRDVFKEQTLHSSILKKKTPPIKVSKWPLYCAVWDQLWWLDFEAAFQVGVHELGDVSDPRDRDNKDTNLRYL